MNLLVETLNHWGNLAGAIFWPILWQSSLLIAVVAGLDAWLHNKLRASLRYLLWLVVLLKLCLPPTFASPTSPMWWLTHHSATFFAPAPKNPHYTVTLVDPAGNRIHSVDEPPFAQTEIPVQPDQVQATSNSADFKGIKEVVRSFPAAN